MAEGQSGNRADVRPSPHDRCAECGEAVDDEWVSYRQDPVNPQALVQHFGGIVRTGPVEPRPDRPKRTPREFRCPEDVGVFFHPSCEPGIKLSEKVQEEIAELLAQALVADFEKTFERWARVRQFACTERDPPRCQAHVASVDGRRVFTMTCAEWERLRAHEGKLVEMEIERTLAEGVGESASAIACLAAERSVHSTQVEVWRYSEKDQPTPHNVQEYLVLENITRRVNLPMFAERASTQDSPKLRKYLREHVFIVKHRLDKGRWEAKAWALERIVFMTR